MAYLIDANVFIAARNLHCGLDFCPAFWDWLVEQNVGGTVFSIERVSDEVLALADELSQWAEARGDGFFLRPDASVLPSPAAVSHWGTGQNYEPAAVSTFLHVADYYLVAQAHAGRHTVVTHEVPSGSPRKIKIPDACIGLGIRCISPFQMLRGERARFVLGPGPSLQSPTGSNASGGCRKAPVIGKYEKGQIACPIEVQESTNRPGE